MKQPRRWVVMLAALLMAASLVFAPREGSAGPAGPEILPGDPRPPVELGVPETPPDAMPMITYRVWISSVLLARGLPADLAGLVGPQTRPPGSQPVRCARRTAARR